MKALPILGHVLLWSGFLYGAFLAVRRTEVAEHPWSTIAWPAFAAALLTAVAGVVLLRIAKRAARGQRTERKGDIDQMAAALERLLNHLQTWQHEEESPRSVFELHQRIDQHLSDDLALFSELRQSLTDAFGLETYAAIMTDFALGERTINRMWSASADGYVDEVAACLQRAIAHLQAAVRRLHAATGAQPSERVSQSVNTGRR